ncbi:hypothetical protein [Actinomycetospora straminea]|uniref:Uncharacterized protein n=1 Tax=Actinomycetospora straminea TaxID=663607 RepID=A0ABP9EJL7_9PSEU|nr:hypothetical protein [Actinomycetospora straminea]MDD7933734.1 hypothetical protein [Actinomycetospora straminea]
MTMPAARTDFRRLLVAPPDTGVPAGWTAVDEALLAGVPHRIPLTGDLVLLLVVPTGLATAWQGAPAAAVVTSSRTGLAARLGSAPGEPVPAPPHSPARLVLLQARTVAGALPLVAAGRALLPPTDAAAGLRIELLVREWDIRAGSLRGPGDVGSRLSLAWRRIDQGSAAWPVDEAPRGRS